MNLPSGTYNNCTIKVTDAAGNASTTLTISSFTVNATRTITFRVANGNGTVSCIPATVDVGSDSVCTMSPVAGNYVLDVRVGPTTGVLASVGGVTGYTIQNVTQDMTLEAYFAPALVKIVRGGADAGYHYGIGNAYGASQTGDIIKMQGISFAEGLDMDRGVDVILSAGWDEQFNTQTGQTEMGMLTIWSGSAEIDGTLIIVNGP